jgi:hypothetical protein
MTHTVTEANSFYKKIAYLIDQQGFVLISYCNELSLFADLFHSKVFKSLAANHLKIKDINKDIIGEIVDFSKDLFIHKWSKIMHLRSIDTWVMDVLLNPVIKIEKTVDTLSMLKTFKDFGLNHWSSWPRYEHIGEMRWHRSIKSVDEKLIDITNQYKKLSLQFLIGHSTDFIHIIDDEEFIEDIYKLCRKVNADLDHSNWAALGNNFKTLIEILSNNSEFVHTEDFTKIISILNMLIKITEYLKLDFYQDLINYIMFSSNHSELLFDFNNYWGQPNHYLALYKN